MATMLKLAEDFYEANKDLCDDLANEIKAAGGDENALDELIQEGADGDGRDSDEASDVNNAGLGLQVASLLEGNGIEEGTRLVRAEIPTASTAP